MDAKTLQQVTSALDRGMDLRYAIDDILKSQEYSDKHSIKEETIHTETSEVWLGPNKSYAAYCENREINSILLIKADHIGDFVLSVDSFMIIRQSFPDAALTLLCGPWNKPLAASLGIFDQIETVDFFADRADANQPHFDTKLVNHVRGLQFELAIDFRVDPDTRIILDYITARYKCGYESGACKSRLTIAMPKRELCNVDNLSFHQRLSLLNLAHCVVDFFQENVAVSIAFRELAATPSGIDLAFRGGRPMVCIQPFSGRTIKNWPFENFVKLVDWLCKEMNVAVLVLGTKADLENWESISRIPLSPHIKSMIGKTSLMEAISIVAASDLYIGNDTGLTHLAARMDIATIALFAGINSTELFAPHGRQVTLIKAPVACSPCGITNSKDCTHDQICMRSINLEFVKMEVMAKLERYVESPRERGWRNGLPKTVPDRPAQRRAQRQ